MCSSNKAGETTTVNAIVYDIGHVAVLMPDERPIKHVVLEAPAEHGMVGDLTWRYYIPESYAATLANENAELRRWVKDAWRFIKNLCKKYPPRLFTPLTQGEPAWPDVLRQLESRTRELGMEVDE